MVRDDQSKFLLYMEPFLNERTSVAIDDSWTELMDFVLSESEKGVANYSKPKEKESFTCGAYKGFHGTDCGQRSTNNDYLLKNGMITNSLCVFYLRYYRNSITESDWVKLKELRKFYNSNQETIL